MLRFAGVLARRSMPTQPPQRGGPRKPAGDYAADLSSPFGKVLSGLAFVATLASGTLRGLVLATGLAASAGLSLALTEAAAQGAMCNFGFANGQSATACGRGAGVATASGAGATAIGADSVASEFLATAIGRQANVQAPSGAIALGNSGAALGSAATAQGDGVAIGSVAFAGNGRTIAIGVGAIATGTPAIGPSGSLEMNSTAIGFQARADGLEAIATGRLTQAIGDTATAYGGQSMASGDATTAIGQASTANAPGGTAVGQGTIASGTNSLALGVGASAANGNASAIGNGATTTRNNQIAIGTATNTYTTPGVTSNASIDAQSGPLSVVTTDANGNLAAQQISTLPTPCSEPVAGALQCGTNSVANATQATALGQTATASGVGSTAVGFGSVASGTGSTAQGQFSVASGNLSSAFGAGANASGTGSLALGAGASATAPNSVALGNGSVASLANTVSVGAPGSERRITNVAAGINPTDAVNVSQLSGLATSLGSQISGLEAQIINNNRVAQAGTAIALALGGTANLQPGRRLALSAGFGNFQGGNAIGVGLTGLLYETKSYAVVANAGVGFGVDTNVVGSRGVISLQW